MQKRSILKVFTLALLSTLSTFLWSQKDCCDSVRDALQKNTQSINKTKDTLRIARDSLAGLEMTVDSNQAQLFRKLDTINLEVDRLEGIAKPSYIFLSRFWIFLSAVLVFFMQAGFKALEVGMVRKRHEAGVGIKNLLDWLMLSAVFFLWGFGLMYGPTIGGFIGWGFWGSDLENMTIVSELKDISGRQLQLYTAKDLSLGMEFILYQLAFAGTAATIVSGAMAERTALTSYVLTALFVGGIIYPIFGHWVWGGAFINQDINQIPISDLNRQTPWLAKLGFFDFAGSTVVHSIGAWVALTGCYMIGARTGRFLPNGSVNRGKFQPNSLGYSILGVFILWFGWWGFNGGSTLKYNEDVASVVLNTNISGAFAGICAYFHAVFTDKAALYEKTIGGVLGGLVAITANCSVVNSVDAIWIGIIAGLIHNFAFDFLLKIRIDDPVGAIPVHGFCGVWGTLCVALFGDHKKIEKFTDVDLTFWPQLGVQLVGILTAFFFAVTLSYLMFILLKNTIGLRVDPSDEETGKLV